MEKAKKIAKKKGIAFTHISTELGKSRGYLSEMLANGRDLPDHMLADVASLLGVTVDDLRGDTENEKKAHRTKRWANIEFAARCTRNYFSLPKESSACKRSIKSCAPVTKSVI